VNITLFQLEISQKIAHFNYLAFLPGSTQPSIEVSQTDIYSVEVTDSNGCSSSDSIYIQFADSPDIILDDIIELELGDSTVLMPSVSSNDTIIYEWSPPEGLSCSDCLNPTAKPQRNQEYLFEVFDELECKDSTSVVININNPTGLIFPNIFSPNGDNDNDIFKYTIASNAVEEVLSFRIFNRWGEEVFAQFNIAKSDENFGWNGFYKNQSAEIGVYIYFVEVLLINGQVVKGSGDITMIK